MIPPGQRLGPGKHIVGTGELRLEDDAHRVIVQRLDKIFADRMGFAAATVNPTPTFVNLCGYRHDEPLGPTVVTCLAD
ncbi:hypothetical protein GCM10023208_22470 [Erythrobacter westpacificensis]|uniref:Uncharacterized protein n=1 Tax=Erythrobacter westpacificensis TaxID=1055231 RepID=A0ABP9KHN0_9SPHN